MSVWESVGRTYLKENKRHQMLQESVSHVSSGGLMGRGHCLG